MSSLRRSHGTSESRSGSLTSNRRSPPRTGVQALALPFAKPTEYGLGRHGWVTVRLAKTTKALAEQCMQWIDESYRAVAPRRVVATLDASGVATTAGRNALTPKPAARGRAKPR